MSFKVGDKVYWETPRPRGAGPLGHHGTVIEVVPAGGVPKHITWSCSPRNHESYLVQNDFYTSIFWPRVKWFKEYK